MAQKHCTILSQPIIVYLVMAARVSLQSLLQKDSKRSSGTAPGYDRRCDIYKYTYINIAGYLGTFPCFDYQEQRKFYGARIYHITSLY